ncbi:MAG: DUF6502 family protein [Acidithiobacillus sp.]
MNEALKTAVLSLLRPLVRYLIGQGWTFGALADLLKTVYVAEVTRHYGESDGRPLTDSRISLLSGIHRKEVKRLRLDLTAGQGRISLRHGTNVAAQVIAAWIATEGYQNQAGRPMSLPLRAETGPSFEALTRLVKADMRPGTLLDELLRVGVIVVEGEMVRLQRTAYVSDLPEDQLAFLGTNVGDHLQSAIHNLEGGPPYFERALYFDDLPAEMLEQIRADLAVMGDGLLRQAHQQVTQMDKAPLSGRRRRMRFGVYYYEEPQKAAEGRKNGDDG